MDFSFVTELFYSTLRDSPIKPLVTTNKYLKTKIEFEQVPNEFLYFSLTISPRYDHLLGSKFVGVVKMSFDGVISSVPFDGEIVDEKEINFFYARIKRMPKQQGLRKEKL